MYILGSGVWPVTLQQLTSQINFNQQFFYFCDISKTIYDAGTWHFTKKTSETKMSQFINKIRAIFIEQWKLKPEV